MKTYEITIKPKSSFVTPLQSDTIFGHVCWACRYRYGEEKLIELLDNIRSGGKFLVSSVFPVEYLPKPKLKPLLLEERESIISDKFDGKRLEAFQAIKKAAKRPLVKRELLEKHINDLSENKLIFDLLDELKNEELNEFPRAKDPNAFITLSNYVPSVEESMDGWYEVFTKYPKVGGEFAIHGFNGKNTMPYKKPILMFAPGSVFKTKNHKNSYGQLIENIHPTIPDVVQHAFAFPVEVRVSE
ncbi:MAG: hypothetical protein HY776_06635 [Actinobacteria bacterium]|nr:hypothetical protein [Actinomycetota bacterium]